ncbi:MAG TPA: SDR family oxidoreductase [Mycobacteriales bacterium]|nr:SDR family oxidoreductase [Mycobacteriales bacterium]
MTQGLPQDFAGKVALVTGGTRGIGLGIAAELVGRGARVAITARKPDELASAVAELGGDGIALGFRGSADDETHQADAVAATVAAFGSLDLLVNNAAVNPHFGATLSADLGVFRKTLEVNVVATFAWVQQAYAAWMRDNGGVVLNIASVGGLRTGTPLGLYGVSKAALIHLTKQLAAELGPGIRVNAIAPAVVKTKFASVLYESDEQGAASVYPMKRLGLPQDTAKLAAFLLGPDATWITGETVVIDGGSLASVH